VPIPLILFRRNMEIISLQDLTYLSVEHWTAADLMSYPTQHMHLNILISA